MTPVTADITQADELRLTLMGIDTLQQPIVFMHRNCHVCRSEGFNALARVQLTTSHGQIIATLNIVDDDRLLQPCQVGLSKSAWQLLQAREDEPVAVSHPPALDSLSYLRAKIYGHPLATEEMSAIVRDIASRRYSDMHLAAFITACVDQKLTTEEVIDLTRAMMQAGQRLDWQREQVMDKHCVGGLPGNRTTPIVVAIVAACGLVIPKTSSRAITSPAGTADTMETLTHVSLSLAQMKQVVEQEGGCLAWGGSVNLSPADDALIRVERALDIDSEGQLVASVLSKKLAAGSTHVLVDLPVGATAKMRDETMAAKVAGLMVAVGNALGMQVETIITDGSQPVGRGIGPALEAEDVLLVLQNHTNAPQDLRQRALDLAARLLEMGGVSAPGEGMAKAEETLVSGAAWRKFSAICEAQGGLKTPPKAPYSLPILASRSGLVTHINNRILARIAKFAGAPEDKAAGLRLATRLGEVVAEGDELFTIYSESPGELEYARNFLQAHSAPVVIEDEYV